MKTSGRRQSSNVDDRRAYFGTQSIATPKGPSSTSFLTQTKSGVGSKASYNNSWNKFTKAPKPSRKTGRK